MSKKETSVIIPVYNEESNVAGTIKKVLEFSAKEPDFNFIFVNDGSVDRTLEILKSEVGEKERIKILSYNPNRGKGFAIKRGVEYVNSDYVVFIDGDLAYSLDNLVLMRELLEKNDVVIGSRALCEENATQLTMARKIFGKGFNFLSRTILGLKYRDMQAGIKGFRKEVAKELFKLQKIRGFAFDVEIIYIGKKKNYSIKEMSVRVSENHQLKKSKVNLIRDSFKMFFNLIGIRLNDLAGKYG